MNRVARARFDGGLDRLSTLIEHLRVNVDLVPITNVNRPAANFFVLRDARGARSLVFTTTPACGSLGEPEGENVEVAARIGISGAGDFVVRALPECITVRLADAPDLQAVVLPLVEEVTDPRCGGQAAFQRLCEVVVIRLLRHAIESGDADAGLLAGLAHPRLARALVAIHEEPDRSWSLERMAEIAGMSRTQFALTFKEILGTTPGVYLSNWRMELAKADLEAGGPVKAIARRSGFSSTAAFSRAFSRRYGHTPTMNRLKPE